MLYEIRIKVHYVSLVIVCVHIFSLVLTDFIYAIFIRVKRGTDTPRKWRGGCIPKYEVRLDSERIESFESFTYPYRTAKISLNCRTLIVNTILDKALQGFKHLSFN